MKKKQLTQDSDFVVGEEKILNFILAGLFLALFCYGVIDAALRHFVNIDYQSYIFALAILPAYLFFRKGQSDRVYIRINKKGLFYDNRLVTNWTNLLHVYIDQKEKAFSIQDNFRLVVEYRKDGGKAGIRKKIPLSNTQNKSEEEILQAIQYFWQMHKKSLIV